MATGFSFLSDPAPFSEFEARYRRVREVEHRDLTDELVARLPNLPASHRLHGEWQRRAQSARRFSDYMRERSTTSDLLEVGCGNGWFSGMLAAIEGVTIVGLDVNQVELEQAARVFTNVRFVYGDLFEDLYPPRSFDVIVLNAAVQYFSDLKALVDRLAFYLRPGGEIHFVDSPMYAQAEVDAAASRSREHYARVDVPEMAACYFHHAWEDVARFDHAVLWRPPMGLKRWFRRGESPFPWIRIAVSLGGQFESPHR